MLVLIAFTVYIVVAAGVALFLGRAISVADREHEREIFARDLPFSTRTDVLFVGEKDF